MIKRFGRVLRLVGGLALLSSALFARSALAQPEGIELQAQNLLKNATSFLAAQKRLSVDTWSTLEVVLNTGQKLQFDHTAILSMQRPNKLRAERRGDLVSQIFYYNGKTFSLHNPDEQYYASISVPDTLENMLDFVRQTLDIAAPAGDLLYANAYEILMQNVRSGFVVGKSMVGGARCDHLAFRGDGVDWQIWIEDGDQPLPRKLVITSTDVLNMPQFVVAMDNWNLNPNFAADIFEFTPPQGATQVEFIASGASAEQSH